MVHTGVNGYSIQNKSDVILAMHDSYMQQIVTGEKT